MNNIRNKLLIVLLLSVLLIVGCSSKKPIIEVGFTNKADFKSAYGRLILSDSRGKVIEDDSTKVYLNDKEIVSEKSIGNYYDEYIYYNLPDMDRDVEYVLELDQDNIRKLIGVIKIDEVSHNNFNINKTHNREEDLVIKYSELNESMSCIIMRSIEFVENGVNTTIAGGPYGKDTINVVIDNSSGEIVVPKDYFISDIGTVSQLLIKIEYDTDFEVSDAFDNRSFITVKNVIEKSIQLID